jgi:hypothetical protein
MPDPEEIQRLLGDLRDRTGGADEKLGGKNQRRMKDERIGLFTVSGANFRSDQPAQSSCEVLADKTKGSEAAKIVASAVRGEYIYGIFGLTLGICSIFGGVAMGLHGVAGSTSWTAKVLGLSSTINDAAPGVVLFVVGLFMVWVTKPRVKLKDISG